MRRILCFVFLGLAMCVASRGEQVQSREEQREAPGFWRKVDDRRVTVPAGAMLAVRLIGRISSDKNQAGDRFEGSLDAPLIVEGTTVAEKDCAVSGRVIRARKGGRMSGPSELVVELVELVVPSHRVPIETDPIERRGDEGSRAGDAVAIGSTAALGTALGAIFGGGRGALIGAAAGGAVGAGGTLGSKGKEIAVKSEGVLLFRLRAPASVKVLEEKEAQP